MQSNSIVVTEKLQEHFKIKTFLLQNDYRRGRAVNGKRIMPAL
jgi:hypothetical protein